MSVVPVLLSLILGIIPLVTAAVLPLNIWILISPVTTMEESVIVTASTGSFPALKSKVRLTLPTDWAARYSFKIVTVLPEIT